MKQQYLKALLYEVLSQCKEIKIPVSDRIIPEVIINRRAKSRFGACKKVYVNNSGTSSIHNRNRRRKKGGEAYSSKPVYPVQLHYFQIEICEAVLGADEQELKNVLAHEVLHTCYGCYNHGKRWKEYASMMNNMYGYNITSTTTYEKIGLQKPEKRVVYRYKIECKKCSKVFYRQKKSKLITNPERYRCTCGGRLKCTENERG